MEYYLDIRILPDPEFKETILINAIYSKFHRALFDLRSTTIGVSFPRYQVTLGNLMRVHGTAEWLDKLQSFNWIGGMSSYCQISEFNYVPSDTKFRTISRKQTTMSQSKLNRLIKRSSIAEEDIEQYKAKMYSKRLDNPYIELTSGSNGQKHRRYIAFGELLDHPVAGKFDQFGLSKTATVPWF
jgi:CRISPR-associated endonuclease Csy4